MKDLLRKYPQWSHDCIAVVGNISSKNVQEPKAKAALVWMLGEYSQDMMDAPYILESLIDGWEDENSPEVFFCQFFSWEDCRCLCFSYMDVTGKTFITLLIWIAEYLEIMSEFTS